MSTLREYQVVRVRQPPASERDDGWCVNRRPPAVGDTGTIVDVLHAPGLPDLFVVECSGQDGITDWLSEFLPDELESLGRPVVEP